ncbi:hypothetical protein AX16_001780 [Volvariella volvacea WC 439]|nr:hypothetical protein AX16_001780 [Volvariella volvacea WC 439]
MFNAFAFLGFFLVLATLLPALLSPRVHRRAAWFCLMFSGLVYSITYLLLVGRQRGPEPPYTLCALQAALVYAAPILCSWAILCFMIDYYFGLLAIFSGKTSNQICDKFVHFVPYVPPLLHIGATILFLATQDPAKIERHATGGFYCHVAGRSTFFIAAALLSVVAIALFLPLKAWTGLMLYRNWHVFRGLSRAYARISLSTYIRMTVFTLTALFAMGMSGIGLLYASEPSLLWNALLPALPCAAALAFGTQRDIFRVYAFWLPEEAGGEKASGDERRSGVIA